MLQARFNLITADPDRMAGTVGYIKSEIRPAVESLHGSMGMSLYVNPEVGVAVLAARVRVETVDDPPDGPDDPDHQEWWYSIGRCGTTQVKDGGSILAS